jgi:succinyl-diaminopimelate desuccinylase
MSPPDPVRLTQELVRLDTVNPTSPERPCAELLGGLLEAAGFRVSRHEFAPGRTSIAARLDAGGGAPLCLAGHLDTVPLGKAPWSRDPFAAEIAGGRLYGRGSSDMKSGVAALACAALEVARSRPRRAGLLVAFVAGEETGCEGSAHLARSAGLGRAGALLVGEPTGNQPLTGHKGALWLRARTRGVTAHGSMPERGVNAVYRAARAVTFLESWRFAAAPDPLLGAPTLNVGTISGGMNLNSVPDEAVVGIDIRTVPGQRHEAVRADLARGLAGLGFEVELEPVVDVEGVRTDAADPWVESVFEACARVLGRRPEPAAAPYFTDAAALAPALGGPPALILGPGELALAHQTDEWCETAKIEAAATLYGEVARRWCGS